MELINYLEIQINAYNPLRAASHIELPRDIAAKKAIINVRNNDNRCFRYAVLSKFAIRDGQRVSLYDKPDFIIEHENYNWAGIDYPVNFKGVDTFEKNNASTSINIYTVWMRQMSFTLCGYRKWRSLTIAIFYI